MNFCTSLIRKSNMISYYLMGILLVYHAFWYRIHCLLNFIWPCTLGIVLPYWWMAGAILYGVHALAHSPGCKWLFHPWWKNHMMGHHKLSFPRTKFQRSEYFNNPIDSQQHGLGTWVYVLPEMVFLGLYFYTRELNADQTIHCGIILLLAILLEDAVHSKIHLTSSRLHQFTWFQYLKHLHWNHHHFYTCNYGILNLSFDCLFQTLRE